MPNYKNDLNLQLQNLMTGALWEAFADNKTVEVIINPDNSLWVEKLGEELKYLGDISPYTTRSIINLVSGYHQIETNANNPICECEFPIDNSRFEGLIPPIVANPCFCLRKKASAIFRLEKYIENNIMTEHQFSVITEAVKNHQNILIVGGTGSGKTTLVNAVIAKMTELFPNERVAIIEDTGEIQCAAKDSIQMRSTVDLSMTKLLKATLRLRPDRILVGEVRGEEALDLLDAWNTGHPGGIATLHANSAQAGLSRLKGLVTRNKSCPKNVESIIGEAVNVVVHIARDKKEGRKVKDIIRVLGFDSSKNQYQFEHI